MHIVAVEVLVIGHGLVPDAVVEEQHGTRLAEDIVLDRRDVHLLELVLPQRDGAAVAARDHHHIAHELVRLIGQAETGAQLQ